MCVGAQKAGTTWLWHYLRRNPKIDFGFKKEYHVWEVVSNPFFKFIKEELEHKIGQGHTTYEKTTQLSFMNNPQLYFDYFVNKLKTVDISGDFTPQSSSLSEQTFNHIIDTFATYDISTKAVYILRDPVDRLQSMVRMKLWLDDKINPSYDTEILFMDQYAASEGYIFSGDYSKIIPKLDKVFKSNIHYCLYENLFADASTKQITDFLQVAHHPADYQFNPRPSYWRHQLTSSDRQHFEQLYEPIYKYTAERFPHVKTLWTYYKK